MDPRSNFWINGIFAMRLNFMRNNVHSNIKRTNFTAPELAKMAVFALLESPKLCGLLCVYSMMSMMTLAKQNKFATPETKFGLYQCWVKYAYLKSYRHLKLQLLIWVTLYLFSWIIMARWLISYSFKQFSG